MEPGSRKWIRAAGVALLVATVGPAAVFIGPLAAPRAETASAAQSSLPERLSDSAFWRLVSDISEPGGYFRIEDNYTSNEREVGRLFTMVKGKAAGGVYMGVGPEQNFTYISAIRPAMAFIVDIRRQAVMQHLMFKAVFELSKDRADFLSLLFAKPRPAAIRGSEPIQSLWNVYLPIPSDTALVRSNLAAIEELLTVKKGFVFTAAETEMLRSVYSAFTYYGPSISTRGASRGSGRGRGGNTATFADLTGWMQDDLGEPQSFLATAANFDYVKGLQDRNLIVPVSGDFGGPKAIRAIADYVKAHAGTVSAFYVSNVEQYLFQDGKQRAFYANVATLPVSDVSIFIRPYALRRHNTVETALCPIKAFLSAAEAGRVLTNNTALACPR